MENQYSTLMVRIEEKYKEYIEAARSSSLSKEDIIPYKQSLEYLREVQRGIAYTIDAAKEKIRKEAQKEFLAKGRQEGREEERILMASNLKNLGVDINTIAQATGLTVEQIKIL